DRWKESDKQTWQGRAAASRRGEAGEITTKESAGNPKHYRYRQRHHETDESINCDEQNHDAKKQKRCAGNAVSRRKRTRRLQRPEKRRACADEKRQQNKRPPAVHPEAVDG